MVLEHIWLRKFFHNTNKSRSKSPNNNVTVLLRVNDTKMPMHHIPKHAKRTHYSMSYFVLYLQPEAPNVCFWYIPPSIRNMPEGPEYWKKLHKVSQMIPCRHLIGTLYDKSKRWCNMLSFYNVLPTVLFFFSSYH